MSLEHRLSALFQLHLHFRLNVRLQKIGQRQLQDEKRNIKALGFGTSYTRGSTVLVHWHIYMIKWTVFVNVTTKSAQHAHMCGWLLQLLKKVQSQVICTTMVSWVIPIVRQSKTDLTHKQVIRPLRHGGRHFVIYIYIDIYIYISLKWHRGVICVPVEFKNLHVWHRRHHVCCIAKASIVIMA